MAIFSEYPLVFLIALGIGLSFGFLAWPRLGDSLIVLSVYVVLVGWLVVRISLNEADAGPIGLITGMFYGAIGLGFNLIPLRHAADRMFGALGREMLSSGIKMKKAYDRAASAETRGDYEAAVAIYREEIAKDDKDSEVHRRLGEALLKMKRAPEAAGSLRAAMDLSPDAERRSTIAFRLAEVLEDSVGDRPGAEAVYNMILRQYPESKYANYARARLRGRANGGPPPARETER